MHQYRVELTADFTAQANTPEDIKRKLRSVLKHEGFTDRSFEITVTRIKGGRNAH